MSECPQVEIMELEEQVAQLQAEVRLQSDSADHWEDEAMNHMSQAAKLQVVVDAAKKAVKQYGVVYPIPSSGHWAMTELEQAINGVE